MDKEKQNVLLEKYYGVDTKHLNCDTIFDENGVISRFETGYCVTTDFKTGTTAVFNPDNDIIGTVYYNLAINEYCKLLYEVQNLKTI